MWINYKGDSKHVLTRNDVDMMRIINVGDIIKYENRFGEIRKGEVKAVYKLFVSVINENGYEEGVNHWNILKINKSNEEELCTCHKLLKIIN